MGELQILKSVTHDKWCKFPNDCMCGRSTDEQFTFFWDGIFSQCCWASFTINSIKYNCAEQYMMAQKAELFEDHLALSRIMKAEDPRAQKQIGRLVRGYTDERWQQLEENGKPFCWNVVFKGNYAKFEQNEFLRKELLKTKGTTLVEASPDDKIWGIGLAQHDQRAQDRTLWLGKNWLGEVLTEVRGTL